MSTEHRGRPCRAGCPAAATAARFTGGAAIAALLAVIASSLLPGAAAAQAQTRLELATVNGGRAYHRWSDDGGNSWYPWTDLGAPSGHTLQGTPTMVSDYPGRLYVISSSDNGLWQNMYNQGAWSGWTRTPGQSDAGVICLGDPTSGPCFSPGGSPTVASWAPGRLDLFELAYSTDGPNDITVIHTRQDNYSWTGNWEPVGSLGNGFPLQGAPAAVSWGWGRIDLFVQGPTGELRHKFFDNGQWSSDWEFLGGVLTSPPVAASMGSGLVTVFTRGTDMNLYSDNFAGGWAGWAAPPTPCCLAGDVTNAVAVTSRAPGSLDVFVIGTLHDLYRRSYSASGWAAWQYLDHVFDYTNIAATAWTPVAPPSGGGGGGGGGPPCGGSTGRPCPLPR